MKGKIELVGKKSEVDKQIDKIIEILGNGAPLSEAQKVSVAARLDRISSGLKVKAKDTKQPYIGEGYFDC